VPRSTSHSAPFSSKQRLWVAALSAAIVGFGLAIELTRLHLVVLRDPLHRSFCSISSGIDCDAVAQSSYSSLFGIPLSLWGAVAYVVIAVVCIRGLRARTGAALGLFSLLAAFAAATSLVLIGISAFAVRSLCILCAGTWLMDLALFALAVVMNREHGWARSLRDLSSFLRGNPGKVLVACALLAGCLLTATWLILPPAIARADVTESAASASPSHSGQSLAPATVPTGVDDFGHYYMGAKEPTLSITEFSDYQCPFCARAHMQLRELVAHNPKSVRLIHRHFPLDNECNPAILQPFHSHACHYARLAICAGIMGHFWKASDYLFEHGRDATPITNESLAKAIGLSLSELDRCLSEKAPALLKNDLDVGNQLGIEGTPTFVVDGKTYTGALPHQITDPYRH